LTVFVVENYNKFAKGVDKLNQRAEYYRYEHRTRKWWKPIFYQFIEIAMVNLYILHQSDKSSKSKLSYKDFRIQVAYKLFQNIPTRIVRMNHRNVLVHEQMKIDKKWPKRCKCCREHDVSYKCKECSKTFGKEIPL